MHFYLFMAIKLIVLGFHMGPAQKIHPAAVIVAMPSQRTRMGANGRRHARTRFQSIGLPDPDRGWGGTCTCTHKHTTRAGQQELSCTPCKPFSPIQLAVLQAVGALRDHPSLCDNPSLCG